MTSFEDVVVRATESEASGLLLVMIEDPSSAKTLLPVADFEEVVVVDDEVVVVDVVVDEEVVVTWEVVVEVEEDAAEVVEDETVAPVLVRNTF